MDPEQQRVAIAEACGWVACRTALQSKDNPANDGWRMGSRTVRVLPDYLNDLNAMHEAEKVLRGHGDLITDYIRLLNKGDLGYRRLAFATAQQRADAFVRVLEMAEQYG
jgi:hypothetical protein